MRLSSLSVSRQERQHVRPLEPGVALPAGLQVPGSRSLSLTKQNAQCGEMRRHGGTGSRLAVFL